MPDLTEQPSPSPETSSSGRVRRRRRHGTTRRRRQRKILIGIVATAVLGAAVWIGLAAFRNSKIDRPAVVSTQQYEFLKQAIDEGPQGADTPTKPELRPVFRFSVVPSGVYSVDEVKRALADPIVAAHYAKVDAAKLKTEVLKADHYAYVSYRKNDKIFWTKNKVLLRAGETVLTDGTTRIRARCGNCISEQPAEPTASDEPDLVEFDRLVDSSPVAAPKTAHAPAVAAPSAAAAAPSTPSPTPASNGSDGSKPAGMPDPMAGGFGGFGTGRGGSNVPLVAATRAAHREPDDDTSAAGPEGPSAGPPLPDLPGPPGGNGPPTLNGLLPPPDGSEDHKWPDASEGPNGPNEPTGFTATETPETPPSANDLNPAVVPEPGTLMLVGGGVAALLRRIRARSR